MNRSDFQQLAQVRVTEGKPLLDAGQYPGAYYMLGYAVECAIKACIARKTNLYDFPPKRKVIEDIYSHDLNKLLSQAGLEQTFQQARQTDPVLEGNWTIVKDWSEKSRYDIAISLSTANDFYSAITLPANGVLPWLMNWC